MMDKNFRKEYKLVLSSAEVEDFLYMFNCKSNEIYEKRQVQSLYMDTKNYDLFYNSESYDIDKYTLRYRKYSNNKNINFEVKENSMLGKHKTSIPSSYKNFEEVKNLSYKNYQTTPTLYVTYMRNYYTFETARITVDKGMIFKSTINRTLSTRIYNSYLNILEIKLLDHKNIDIEYLLLQNPQKFSKYKYGVSKIYNLLG